jgi:hypothetical protein
VVGGRNLKVDRLDAAFSRVVGIGLAPVALVDHARQALAEVGWWPAYYDRFELVQMEAPQQESKAVMSVALHAK